MKLSVGTQNGKTERTRIMKELTRKELKQLVATQFDAQTGCRPRMNDITLLEASGDGEYIRFMISVHEYVYRDSYHFEDGERLGEIYRVEDGHEAVKPM